MNVEQTTGGVGTVNAGGLSLTVTPLSQADEVRLYDRLRDRAKAAQGNYLAANRAMVDSADPRDRQTVVAELVRMEAERQPLSPQAVHLFRRTPEGAQVELYARTRVSHPQVTETDIAAVVTAANAVEVHEQLVAAAGAKDVAGKS